MTSIAPPRQQVRRASGTCITCTGACTGASWLPYVALAITSARQQASPHSCGCSCTKLTACDRALSARLLQELIARMEQAGYHGFAGLNPELELWVLLQLAKTLYQGRQLVQTGYRLRRAHDPAEQASPGRAHMQSAGWQSQTVAAGRRATPAPARRALPGHGPPSCAVGAQMLLGGCAGPGRPTTEPGHQLRDADQGGGVTGCVI